jgi:hypothetical protein
MRRVILLAMGLLLVGAGAAYTAGSPNAKLAAEDRVWGGGQFGPGCSLEGSFCIGDPRNFAVDAHAQNDGSAAVGNSAYGGETSRTVTCVRVQGNTAVIGGVITAGAALGAGYVQYFVDQGTTSLASPAHDLASASIIGPLDDPAWPAGFPDVCPPATGTPNLPAAYFQVDAGDVNVQAAAN